MECRHRAAFPGLGKMYIWCIAYRRQRGYYRQLDEDDRTRDFTDEISHQKRLNVKSAMSPMDALDFPHKCRKCGSSVRFVRNMRNNALLLVSFIAACFALLAVDPTGVLLSLFDLSEKARQFLYVMLQAFVAIPLAWYVSMAVMYAFGECAECDIKNANDNAAGR